MRQTACVVTVRSDGAMLAVARPQLPVRFGFPGGGVERGETAYEAAQRELTEETGLHAPELVPICVIRTGKHDVVFFYATDVFGNLRSSDEGLARWVDPRVLYCKGAAYPRHARAVLRKIGQPLYGC